MHLGLIIYGNLNALTGGYIYDRLLVEHLRKRGHRVDIISLRQRSYGRHLLDNYSRRLRSDLAQSCCDVLLQDELSHPSLCRINRLLAQQARFPTVAIVHQVLCRQPRNGFVNRIYRTIETRYLKSVDAFIFNSRTSAEAVGALVDGKRASIIATPAGNRLGYLLSRDLIDARSQAGGPLRLIFVGNLLPQKGLAPLISVLSKLSRNSWQLTVVGSLKMNPSYARRIKKLIVRHRLDGHVELTGPKDNEDLRALLSRSHVFVMPYSHEGFGMAHLEAMAYGLPVIGSSSGAVKEFVMPDVNGFLVDPGDENAVLECLNGLYQDRQQLARMSRAALQTFQGHPKWHDTMEAIERFLHDLCRQG